MDMTPTTSWALNTRDSYLQRVKLQMKLCAKLPKGERDPSRHTVDKASGAGERRGEEVSIKGDK